MKLFITGCYDEYIQFHIVSTIMSISPNLEIFYEIIDKGQTYNTVRERYPTTNSAYCDFCQKPLTQPFIGYDKTDLCFNCSNTLTIYMAKLSVPGDNQELMPAPVPAPIPSKNTVYNVGATTKMYSMTRMEQDMFTPRTRMQQMQFTNVKKVEISNSTPAPVPAPIQDRSINDDIGVVTKMQQRQFYMTRMQQRQFTNVKKVDIASTAPAN